jgi:hypothetical protein
MMRISLVVVLASFFLQSCSAFTSVAPIQSSANVGLSGSALYVGTASKTKAPVFDEVCETTGVTLKRFMSEVAMVNPELEEMTVLFGAIETACKAISNLVKRSQLPSSETLGYEGNVNVQVSFWHSLRKLVLMSYAVYFLLPSSNMFLFCDLLG